MAAVHAGVKRSYQETLDSVGLSNGSGYWSRVGQPSPLNPRSRAPSNSPLPPRSIIDGEKPAAFVGNVSFEPDASIVLIGIRGVGKSTLGVLAATAYNRRLVDSDKTFLEATGNTTTAYRKQHGIEQYQQRHNRVLEETLRNHSRNAVIICSFSDLERNGKSLVSKYAQSHPVIHITRDVESIQSHLPLQTTGRIDELLSASIPLLRSCSNFEFYNLSDNGPRDGNTAMVPSQPGQDTIKHSGGFLTLKAAERDFLRLLRNIIGDRDRGPSHRSAYPLSQVSLADRHFTFAVSVTASDVVAGGTDLDTLQLGADCIELVVEVDKFDGHTRLNEVAKAFAIIRRSTILPIMLSSTVSECTIRERLEDLARLIEYCFRLGPDLCSVDMSLPLSSIRQLMSGHKSSRTVAVSEFSKRPDGGWHDNQCVEAYKLAAEIGFDLVKITMPAMHVDDVFAVHEFRQTISTLEETTRLIAYSTGMDGTLSKCLNKTLTPVEYDPRSQAENSTEIPITAQSITEARFASFILQPLRFHVYGADVSYSLSPTMHNASYEACGMRYNYTSHSSENLDLFKRLSQELDFGGTAIAQPFKTTVAACLDGLSPHAKAIGAVNTVVPVRKLSSDGNLPSEPSIVTQHRRQGPVKALYGFNTDWIGIRACLRRGLSPANTIRPSSTALVCGAGGMARAAIYSLISLGVQNIFVCNRTPSNATALAERYNQLTKTGGLSHIISETSPTPHVRVIESFTDIWPPDARQPTIIVSCIPRQNISGDPTNFSISNAWLQSPTRGVVVEVAYSLPVSPLVQQIKDLAPTGWIFADGVDVIPEQAYSQFELFTGRRAPRKLMKDEMVKHFSTNNN